MQKHIAKDKALLARAERVKVGKPKSQSKTRNGSAVSRSGRSGVLHEKNVFPNRTENLRTERKFDLSGTLIKA